RPLAQQGHGTCPHSPHLALTTITLMAAAGKKRVTRLDLAGIQTQISRGRYMLRQPLQYCCGVHRTFSAPGPTATSESMGASGWTPRRRKLRATISEKIGAAIRPP